MTQSGRSAHAGVGASRSSATYCCPTYPKVIYMGEPQIPCGCELAASVFQPELSAASILLSWLKCWLAIFRCGHRSSTWA